MPKRSPRKRRINPAKLRLKPFLISLLLVALAAAGTKVAHWFGDAETKERIESGVVAVIDCVRENPATPDEMVFILDELAQRLPFVRGKSVDPGTTLDLRSAALAGTPVSERRLTLLKNAAYVVGYDEARGNPAWCAYRVFRPKTTQAPERPERFETDTRTRARVESEAYSHTGYDRGHMAPNHAVALCYGEAAQRETFLMSNVVPQLHELNAGPWKALEQRVLSRYARSFEEVWILCGPLYASENPTTLASAKKRGAARSRGVSPAVPDAFFLIVTDRDESTGALRALAFIVPHRADLGTNPKRWLASIDEIERRARLDFFPLLPQSAQAELESDPAKTIW